MTFETIYEELNAGKDVDKMIEFFTKVEDILENHLVYDCGKNSVEYFTKIEKWMRKPGNFCYKLNSEMYIELSVYYKNRKKSAIINGYRTEVDLSNEFRVDRLFELFEIIYYRPLNSYIISDLHKLHLINRDFNGLFCN